MRRLFIFIALAPLSGCVGFDNYAYEGYSQPEIAPSTCGCSTPTISTAAAVPGRTPIISQIPAGQTGEPELAHPGH